MLGWMADLFLDGVGVGFEDFFRYVLPESLMRILNYVQFGSLRRKSPCLFRAA